PAYEDARHDLSVFAELERAPEHIHTYRITRLGLWNARAAGHTADEVIETLGRYAKFPMPSNVELEIRDSMERYGKLRIERRESPEGSQLVLTSDDPLVLREVSQSKSVADLLGHQIDPTTYEIAPLSRGELKQALLKRGWPADDLAGFTPGAPHEIDLIEDGWAMRDYQRKAVVPFETGGSGVVVLPCSAGKTIVGAGAMA